MFHHEFFDVYPFDAVPLDRDIYLMDEKWLPEYEAYMLSVFAQSAGDAPGAVGAAAARKIDEFALQLSWYPNFFTRFHEVAITLPKASFVACVGSWRYDEKPHIFVNSQWIENLYARSFSIFAMIDAIGVKKALTQGALSRDRLIRLRTRIDELASDHPDISFVTFADTLLLKSNWRLASDGINPTYAPERFLTLFREFQDVYRDLLELEIYCVLTQGSNEFYEDSVLHISPSQNHVSLNSLGIPFAQLLEIDKAVRAAIKTGVHGPQDIYMDRMIWNSLRFRFGFDKRVEGNHSYHSPLTETPGTYYFASCQRLMDNLDRSEISFKLPA